MGIETALIGVAGNIAGSIIGGRANKKAAKDQAAKEAERHAKNVELTREAMGTLKYRTDRAVETVLSRRTDSLGTFQERLLQDVELLGGRSAEARARIDTRSVEDEGTIESRTAKGLAKIGVRTKEDFEQLDARTLESFGLLTKGTQDSIQRTVDTKVRRNLAIRRAGMKAKGQADVEAAASGSSGRRVTLTLNRESGQLEADSISASKRQQIDEMTDLQVSHDDALRQLKYYFQDTTKELTRRQEDVVQALLEQREDALTQLTRQYTDLMTNLDHGEADAMLDLSRREADVITQDKIATEDALYDITNYYNDTAKRMLDNLNNSAPVYSNVAGSTMETVLGAALTGINAYGSMSEGQRTDFKASFQKTWDSIKNWGGKSNLSFASDFSGLPVTTGSSQAYIGF